MCSDMRAELGSLRQLGGGEGGQGGGGGGLGQGVGGGRGEGGEAPGSPPPPHHHKQGAQWGAKHFFSLFLELLFCPPLFFTCRFYLMGGSTVLYCSEQCSVL